MRDMSVVKRFCNNLYYVSIWSIAKKMLLLRVLVYTKLDQLGKLESHSLSREWPALWHSCVCTEDKREILSQPSNGLFVAGNIEDLLGLCNCTPHVSMYTTVLLGSRYHHPILWEISQFS